ncbi:15444_t:CDS:1, partial [Racocetra persica]
SPIRSDPLVLQLLKTIEATHTHKPINQKSHITCQHLLQIQQQLNANNNVDTLFWAIALLAFYGLARLGELLPNNQSDEIKVPTMAALKFELSGSNTFIQSNYYEPKNTSPPI